ncbi:MAG: protein TolQ [Gammaproteobacteria bacterium]|jgi:biopolymer transport protein TolQ
MSTNLSIVELVGNASFIVQMVLLLLLLASIASWAVIFRKRRMVRQAWRHAEDFERKFWSGGDLTAIFKEVAARKNAATGMENIFEAGFREFARARRQAGNPAERAVEGARRAMHVARTKEIDRLESNLAFLATVGSTSPYVGLFGTVWGIMSAFQALGNVQHATLAMVAPGISEALIATAMGLFAAIPAVVGYNRFANQVERLETRFDTFLEEFTSILHRNIQVTPEVPTGK